MSRWKYVSFVPGETLVFLSILAEMDEFINELISKITWKKNFGATSPKRSPPVSPWEIKKQNL